jgi:hypothetical protein
LRDQIGWCVDMDVDDGLVDQTKRWIEQWINVIDTNDVYIGMQSAIDHVTARYVTSCISIERRRMKYG